MDWSCVIGVLSILVTVLIGWNIYTLIDFNGRVKRLKEDLLKDMEEKAAKVSSEAAGLTLLQSTAATATTQQISSAEIIRLTLNALSLIKGSIERHNIEETEEQCEELLKYAVYNYKGGLQLDSQEEVDLFIRQVQKVKDRELRGRLLKIVIREVD